VYLAYRRLFWGNVRNRKVLKTVEDLLADLINDVVEMQQQYQ
jgi:hypothetical protein